MSYEPVRVACVGIGRWSDVIARAVGRSDKLKVASCFTRSADKRAAFAQKFGCDQAATYEELLADDRVEAVLVTTPNPMHLDTIAQAAAAGKHVWVEKPIAHSMDHTKRIGEAVSKAGVTFSVGHSARLLGGSRKMKELVDQGDLGKVVLVEADYSNERALELTPDKWRYYASNSPGGPLVQLLVHHFDTVQYILGPISEVQAYKRRLHTTAEVDDVAVVIAQFDKGYLGTFGGSWSSPGAYSIDIYGTDANLYHTLDFAYWTALDVDQHCTLVREARGAKQRVPVELPTTDMFREELENFADAIRNGSRPEVGWEESARAMAVVEAAIRSSDIRRPVSIAEVMA
ncbi:MAG TPA: Gfo/Idh/MocA family oxidoreductase [Anaerolineae bacterium]|nr:Gfo/Idh/MocA family oxidoreductase [Anaerolineae bacterium]